MIEMIGNSADAEKNHAIRIWEVNNDRLALMHQKISETPKLLSLVAGRSSCCIFRVPQSLIDVNGKCYQPHIVSIGPYHRGKPHLQMIEEHKWRYLGSLLSRTRSRGMGLEDFFKAIESMELKARDCYSETIHLDSHEFLEIMVIDGFFMIELFRKVAQFVSIDFDDPLFTMSWVLPFFYRDFLRVENQIPYFILECLFDLSKTPREEEIGPSLAKLAMEFFNNGMQRPDEVIAKHSNLKGRHLLDLVRSSFIPPDLEEPHTVSIPTNVIQCVSKLRRAGIKLLRGQANSFLIIKFQHGVIEMPTITIDDFMGSFLLNCVAYEQCHKSCSKHFTTYATFLDCLVNTDKDVEYLCDSNIVENYFGTDGEIARLINNLGKDVAFDIDLCYLAKLFNDVHNYYRNSWHVQWASFKYTYFDTPWSFISALAALILVILTFVQAYFAVYGFFYEARNKV